MFENLFQKDSTKSIIIVVLLVLFAAIVQLSSKSFMANFTSGVVKPLESADSIGNRCIENSLSDTSLKIVTLKRQYLISGKIKNYYEEIGITYYINYYAFSICSIMFTTLLTIAAFLIANKGWQNASIILRSFLITNVLLASIYYFLPNVISNKDNFKNNLEKVKYYQSIQYDILSFSSNIQNQNSNKIDTAIMNNYKNISANFDFINSIDDSKLNTNLSTILKNYSPK